MNPNDTTDHALMVRATMSLADRMRAVTDPAGYPAPSVSVLAAVAAALTP